MNKFIFLLTLPFFLLSCSDNDEKETHREIVLKVASRRDTKSNIEETPGYYYIYYVKTVENNNWESFPYEILNFRFEEGNEYVIKVLEVTYSSRPADAPLHEYRFIEQISKVEKESENLPDL